MIWREIENKERREKYGIMLLLLPVARIDEFYTEIIYDKHFLLLVQQGRIDPMKPSRFS